ASRDIGSVRPAAAGDAPAPLCPAGPDSLTAWVRLYGAVEAGANAANTVLAKGRDLGQLMRLFADRVRSDHPDQWAKAVPAAFLPHLEVEVGPASMISVVVLQKAFPGRMRDHPTSCEAG